MSSLSHKMNLAIASTLVVSSFQWAAAQTVEEEILVIGQLQERSLQDTHASVAVFTGDQLDQDTMTDLFDVFSRTAGVSVSEGGFSISMRGVRDAGVGGAGNGLTININVDGASPVTSQGIRTGTLSTWDLEQVEVLRGPQSTQQGRNALAGSVYIRSKDPTFEEELKVRADYGDYDEHRLALAGNLPLINDTLAMRLSYEDFQTDGFVENPTLGVDDFGLSELQTWRAKLRYQPLDSLNIVLGHSVSDNRLGGTSIDLDEWPAQRLNFSNVEYDEGGTTTTTNLRASYDVAEQWSLESETTLYENDYSTHSDADNSAADFGSGGRDIIDENISQDLRASYQGERLRGVVGFYYADIDTDLDFLAIVPGSLVGLPDLPTVELGDTQDTKLENYAIYGEADYDLTSRWTLTAGVRYDQEDREDVLTSSFAGSTTPPEAFDASYDAVLPKLGLTYAWSDELSTGFTIQRGYRAGGSGLNGVGDRYEFDPEFTTNYEWSVRSMHLDGRLTANANLFYTQWEDQQVTVEGPSGTFLDSIETNAAESELYGLELELGYRPTANFDSYLSLGYTETEYKDFIDRGEDFSGNEFSNAPNLTGSIGGTYRFAKGFELQLTGSYTGSSYSDAGNAPEDESDSYFIVDTRLGYRAEQWSAFLTARNLLDKDYITRRREGEDDATDNAGEPRVIGFTITANY